MSNAKIVEEMAKSKLIETYKASQVKKAETVDLEKCR